MSYATCKHTHNAGTITRQMNIGPAISLLRNDATEAPPVRRHRQEQTASSQQELAKNRQQARKHPFA